jgi:hypothetical protein
MLQIALFAYAAKKLGSSKLHGALRVAAYAGGLTLVLGGVGAHKARAALNQKGLEFGEDIASLSSMMKDAHTFRLNGQTIHTNSGTSLEGMTALLDKFEAQCKASTGASPPVWNGLPEVTSEPPKNHATLTMMPILRQETGRKGMVACFVPSDSSGEHTERAFAAALKEFQDTGNFAALGAFHYAYVKESTTGSMVITVSTDGDFNVNALLPVEGGDTAGADPAVLMRPGNANRVFTGTIDGMPYRVYGYTTHATAKQAIDAYDAQMEKAGWLSVNHPLFEDSQHQGNEGHAYISDTKGFGGVVSAIDSPNGLTVVGVAEVTDGVIHPPTAKPTDADGI